ncbi:MAG: hypothetical protein R6X10_14390 [Desulfobacterales bacterium]
MNHMLIRFKKTTPSIPKLLAFGVLWILFLIAGFPGTGSSETETTAIYFHSSETSINNFKSLKIKFDRYLSQFGPYEFQPVRERTEFEKQITSRKDCVMLLSSWHYRKIHKTGLCEPVLVGFRNGKKTQKRVLVAPEGYDFRKSHGLKLASASSLQHSRSMIKNMPAIHLDADSLRILTVPKDIDAMMAVSFGMSEAALITENSYNRIKSLNTLLYKKINIIAEGPESHLMVLAAHKACLPQMGKLIQIIQKMSENSSGQKQIHMLGLNGFKNVTQEDLLMLEASPALIRQQVNR